MTFSRPTGADHCRAALNFDCSDGPLHCICNAIERGRILFTPPQLSRRRQIYFHRRAEKESVAFLIKTSFQLKRRPIPLQSRRNRFARFCLLHERNLRHALCADSMFVIAMCLMVFACSFIAFAIAVS